jgi:hypothetical protein
LIRQRHPAQQFAWAQPAGGFHPPDAMNLVRQRPRNALRSRIRRFAAPCALVLAVGLAGCHHKPVRPLLPIGVLAPVELEPSAPVENPPEIAMLPEPELGPLPAGEPPTPPRRRAPPAPRESEQPVQVAVNDAAAATLAIGALSAGGEDTAHTSQQAVDLINAVLKRIKALSSQIASAQKKEIRQARNYLDQAQKALNTGDAEGAHTLATKASLLIDEVDKK